MVLTVHASSTCDVCLEPYDWDTNNRKPHFIGCGHVFCGTCLEHIQPKKCPLCRTLFTTDDIQRLNVGPDPGPILSQHSDIEAKLLELPPLDKNDEVVNDLMKKLIMSYDSADKEVKELLQSTDAWLLGRESDENCPVRKARAMITSHQELKSRRRHDRRKMRELQSAIQDSEKKAEECAARLAEEVRRQDDLRCQIEDNQKEIELLREKIKLQDSSLDLRGKQKQKQIHSSNPLPVPPRPVGASAFARQLFKPNHEAIPPMTTPYPVHPIQAPAPRYPEPRTHSPGIVQSFGLLTFNHPVYDTAMGGKYWGCNEPPFSEHDLGPGQVIDDATYWTCQTATNLLPETRSPVNDWFKGSISENAKKGRSRRHGA